MKRRIDIAGSFCNWVKKLPAETSIIIFLISVIFFASAHASKDSWVFVGAGEDNLWFIDADTIMCKENSCKASLKMQPIPEKNKYTIELNEYACTEMKYKPLRLTNYDLNMNTVKSAVPERQKWNSVVPKSIRKEVYDFVCNDANHKKEQPDAKVNDRRQLTMEDLAREHETEQTADSTKEFRLQDTVSPKEEVQGGPFKNKEQKALQSEKSSDNIFTVQVGAFKNDSYAEALTARLKEKGYTAYIMSSGSRAGGKLQKVCIGKFSDRKNAKALSQKIRKSEGLQAFVTSLQP